MASKLSNYDSTLGGKLLLGSEDAWLRYRTFLHEDKAGGTRNYSALLAPSSTKAHKAVSYREEDGERLPEHLAVRLEARDVTLHFAMLAGSKEDFMSMHEQLLSALRQGDGSGYLSLSIPELDRTWRLVYLSGGDYTLSDIDGDIIVGRFSVKFREPHPSY